MTTEPRSLWQFLRRRLPYLSFSRYSEDSGALYMGRWSFHWGQDGPVVVRGGKVLTLREQPRRSFTVYRGLHTVIDVPLWPLAGWCEHGFRHTAWWHRCDYVTAENRDGRVPDQEINPQDYDEHGVHWSDRTCFCEMKPEYSICSMHPDEDDE